MKDWIILTIYALIIIAFMAVGFWIWWVADCDFLVKINYTMPGRCFK